MNHSTFPEAPVCEKPGGPPKPPNAIPLVDAPPDPCWGRIIISFRNFCPRTTILQRFNGSRYIPVPGLVVLPVVAIAAVLLAPKPLGGDPLAVFKSATSVNEEPL